MFLTKNYITVTSHERWCISFQWPLNILPDWYCKKNNTKNGGYSAQNDSNAGRVFLSWRYHAMYSNIQYIINNI